jgi:hypothetical protein
MESGIAINLGAGVVTHDYAPPIAAAAQATATELPAAKAVMPAAGTVAVRNDQPSTTHEVIIDPQSREVIYRVIDVRSRQVVRQVPDEALLRVRAYARAIASGDSPSKAETKADIEV